MLHIRILTPERQVFEEDVKSITCQTVDGEITILPHHAPLLTLLTDGIITVRRESGIEFFSAGSGYIETDGKQARLLISQAYGQKELDEKKIQQVEEEAKKLLSENKSAADRERAFSMLRRASIDLKVLRRTRRSTN